MKREEKLDRREVFGIVAATSVPVAIGLGSIGCTSSSPETARDPALADARMEGYFPNPELITHEGNHVRFYDDLVRDSVVLINFMFTTCEGICPGTTGRLVEVQRMLGDRVGRDISMLSITLDPEVDSPEVLSRYASQYRVRPGWLFLTGDFEEIENLRRKLGVYDPDPIVDADKNSHAGLLPYGNERTGTWAAVPAFVKPGEIVKMVLRVADAGPAPDWRRG